MHTIYWDMETRSAVSLRECGAYAYAIDPTTQALCLVYAIDDEDPKLWLPADPPPSVFHEITANPKDWELIAHNWEFERSILENILIPRHGFLPIPLESQHCTSGCPIARIRPRAKPCWPSRGPKPSANARRARSQPGMKIRPNFSYSMSAASST